MSKILNEGFYTREDVVSISRELLGKVLCTSFNGKLTKGIISETEAYAGALDKASHAYGNRKTERTRIMFGKGGRAYVYLCYGVHSLFNIVTAPESIPHAVLIRAIVPVCGMESMKERIGSDKLPLNRTNGPGKICKALGIHYSHSGLVLNKVESDGIWVEDNSIRFQDHYIDITPRIGIDYAAEDALLPYRFVLCKAFRDRLFHESRYLTP